MMRKSSFFLVMLTISMIGSSGKTDTYIPVKARLISSPSENFGVKILLDNNPREPATGLLFHLEDNGREKVIWKQKLINEPGGIVIQETVLDNVPLVATIGNFSIANEHFVVIYDRRGKITILALFEKVLKTWPVL